VSPEHNTNTVVREGHAASGAVAADKPDHSERSSAAKMEAMKKDKSAWPTSESRRSEREREWTWWAHTGDGFQNWRG
jgi:malate synthase